MTKFDAEAAEAARAADPSLTVFDTGEMLEPQPHHPGTDSQGSVDFDDNEGATAVAVAAWPSTVFDDTVVVQIDTFAPGRFKIMLNESEVFHGDPEADGYSLDDVAGVRAAVDAANVAADGGSNDDEIDALQRAVDAAVHLLKLAGIDIAAVSA